jgi:hypothetical protein
MDKVFVVLDAAQRDEIKALCFGTCGKIVATGAVLSETLGLLWVCRQQTCPYKRAETDEPIGQIPATREEVWLRSLNNPAANN